MHLRIVADQQLKEILADDKVGIILGARQVGKTTLVEHVLEGQTAAFLNFDIEVDKTRCHNSEYSAHELVVSHTRTLRILTVWPMGYLA